MANNISALTVFLQGLISFWSPCVLPLIPIYLGYLSGGTVKTDDAGNITVNRKTTMINTLFFVLGISSVFMLLGLGSTTLGSFFNTHKAAMVLIGGIIIITFGIVQLFLSGNGKGFKREKKINIDISKLTMSPVTAFVMGFTFSFAWTPCIGPILASVLLLASSMKTGGFILILIYTAGFIIPFIALGLFTYQVLNLIQKHKNLLQYTIKFGGILMLIIGFYMIYSNWQSILKLFN